jgi:hypothetical protein
MARWRSRLYAIQYGHGLLPSHEGDYMTDAITMRTQCNVRRKQLPSPGIDYMAQTLSAADRPKTIL